MIPGEIRTAEGMIEINAGRPVKTVRVANTGDRPIQVGLISTLSRLINSLNSTVNKQLACI